MQEGKGSVPAVTGPANIEVILDRKHKCVTDETLLNILAASYKEILTFKFKWNSLCYISNNGDIVLSDTDPGYWTLQLAAMEGRKDVVSAYFDVDVETDGGISIKGAGLKKEWILVLVALDQQDRPFLLYGTNAKVSDRDDVSLKSSEIMNFSMTFKMLKGTNGEQFHAWGLVTEDAK